jgi:glutamate dehydrogenase (NAD(P)+)
VASTPPAGLKIDEVLARLSDTGSVVGLPGSEAVSDEAILELAVAVLIPAALGEVITHHNGQRVQAKLIVEGANHPATPVADDALADLGCSSFPTSWQTPAVSR